MKRCLLLVIILLVPFVLAETLIVKEKAETWSSKEIFTCDVCCVENDQFSLTTVITNNGSKTLWIGNAKLIDKDGKEFASYNPSDTSFRYGLLPDESMNLEYEGKWPKPSIKNSLFYKQCIYRGTFGKWECEEHYKEKIIAKSVDFQCYKDSDCPFDQVCYVEHDCTVSKCEILSIAKECGRISRGKWRSYECCLNQSCKDDQYCLNHNCEQVECDQCGYVHDHKCVVFECCDDADCESNQVCTNNKCAELSCGHCEHTDEHVCKKNDCCQNSECEDYESCADNECQEVVCEKGFVEGHKCVLYQCNYDRDCKEGMVCKNGFCAKLKCKHDELIENHECQESNSLLGYVKYHKYVSYFSKEAYQDNKKVYIVVFIVLAAFLVRLFILKAKKIIKEKIWEKSYIHIKPKKGKQ